MKTFDTKYITGVEVPSPYDGLVWRNSSRHKSWATRLLEKHGVDLTGNWQVFIRGSQWHRTYKGPLPKIMWATVIWNKETAR